MEEMVQERAFVNAVIGRFISALTQAGRFGRRKWPPYVAQNTTDILQGAIHLLGDWS
jgi:hypothetical protein